MNDGVRIEKLEDGARLLVPGRWHRSIEGTRGLVKPSGVFSEAIPAHRIRAVQAGRILTDWQVMASLDGRRLTETLVPGPLERFEAEELAKIVEREIVAPQREVPPPPPSPPQPRRAFEFADVAMFVLGLGYVVLAALRASTAPAEGVLQALRITGGSLGVVVLVVLAARAIWARVRRAESAEVERATRPLVLAAWSAAGALLVFRILEDRETGALARQILIAKLLGIVVLAIAGMVLLAWALHRVASDTRVKD